MPLKLRRPFPPSGLLHGLPALAALAVLGACSSAPPPTPCPTVAIADGAARRDVYEPGRAGDLEGRRYGASLGNIGGNCTSDGTDTVVDFTVDLFVQRGPAADAQSIDVPIRVGVIDPNGQIIERETVTARVPLQGEGVTIRQPLTQRIPGVSGETVAGYAVLLGFPVAP
ncbi:hypothetical protein [Marinivivus vitaminiproducens]|uniref:hypothetical protein n=1 Tax=Marinivivus vitaminiproducens TaxID=3035935 RepID=UPI0027A5AEEC|nr:hypothetical protein P4R82_13250 [Geminicoccaceae bacterium SCSIO 64248]